MGLDIYFYKRKNMRYEGDELQTPMFYHRLANEEEKNKMTKKVKELIKKVYNYDGELGVEFMQEHILPELPLKGDDWLYVNNESKFVNGDSIIEWLFDVLYWYGRAIEDAYFRKVNFIYRYFGNKLEDESCIVTQKEIEDIIDRCKQVLEDHSLAEELLPTTSGFFFGSTDYDDWYFKDVADCQKQMESLLEDYDETKDVIWVDMSW